jgi:flavodoxin I
MMCKEKEKEKNAVAKLLILYDSQTGNTEKMAEAVAEGAKAIPKVEVDMKSYARPEEIAEADAIVFGTPTYYHDMTLPIKQMLEETAKANVQLKGKVGAAFGSYGWSGEAPELVLEILRNRFGMKATEPPLTVLYMPNEAKLEECRKLGRAVAQKIAS